MANEAWKETLIEQRVRYVLEMDGQVAIVENVPARVCVETGERFFAPETVERLQRVIWETQAPARVVENSRV